MSIRFGCDFCKFESKESTDIKEVNFLQVGMLLSGKRLPTNEMLKKGGNHLCNACYTVFAKWSDNELSVWVKDNFPLGKPKEDDNSG